MASIAAAAVPPATIASVAVSGVSLPVSALAGPAAPITGDPPAAAVILAVTATLGSGGARQRHDDRRHTKAPSQHDRREVVQGALMRYKTSVSTIVTTIDPTITAINSGGIGPFHETTPAEGRALPMARPGDAG